MRLNTKLQNAKNANDLTIFYNFDSYTSLKKSQMYLSDPHLFLKVYQLM